MEEIWKDIKGYENLYQISNLGRVKSLERIDKSNHLVKEKILKIFKTRKRRKCSLMATLSTISVKSSLWM